LTDNENPPILKIIQMQMGSDGKLYTAEKHTQEEDSSYLSFATAASSLIRSATTGKSFRVRTIVACNNLGGVDKTLKLTDGSGVTYTKIKLVVGSGINNNFLQMEDIKGLVFDSGIYVIASSFSTGMSLFIGGEIEPNEPAP
jgi:hypothetical protein